ncbi:Transcription factor MYB1R1 [Heracleum sosnowskyi]|uniref:Transcription factor MYB1R1 n=1 Tax=Heracleum sosnowskyi TaxID=360622 RepID=A0AAD8HBC5_9APIA|nr:Transcription factor MYB1R1 [Heracleum sosnowskyi]
MMSRSSRAPVVAVASPGGEDGSGEIMLFGVRVKVDPMRKSVSMNNLSEYALPNELTNSTAVDVSAAAAGYASADDVVHHQSTASRERKRGVPWTEEEHKLFLLGLQKVGKGDWRGISRNFVKTRTPTQVASHAQKYFLRRSNLNRRRRRSSLFDITTDSVTAIPMEEEHVYEDNVTRQSPETHNSGVFQVAPYPGSVGPVLFPKHENLSGNQTFEFGGQVNNASSMFADSVSPAPSTAVNNNKRLKMDDSLLSLNLSLSSSHHDELSSRHSVYQGARNFSIGDSTISVRGTDACLLWFVADGSKSDKLYQYPLFVDDDMSFTALHVGAFALSLYGFVKPVGIVWCIASMDYSVTDSHFNNNNE